MTALKYGEITQETIINIPENQRLYKEAQYNIRKIKRQWLDDFTSNSRLICMPV